MKKIYTLASAILFTSVSFAQSTNLLKAKSSESEITLKKKTSTLLNKSAAGPFSGRLDVGLSLLQFRGQYVGTTMNTTNIGTYLGPVYMDSTVKASFTSSTDFISSFKQGVTFDPQSIIYDPNLVPLFANSDTYYLDTVWIGGVYKRVSLPSVTDTLLVEIVYGDTANAGFGVTAYGPAQAPVNTFGRFLTPRVNRSNAQGSVSFCTAALTNKKTFKVPLTELDSATFNQTSYLPVVVNGTTGLMLNGSNKISVVYSFIPGAPTPFGSVVFGAGTSPQTPQTHNGFSGVLYQQKFPAISNFASIVDYFDDPAKGKNVATEQDATRRYGTGTTTMFPNFYSCYWVDLSIHGNSSVNVNELKANGAVLSQNVPNPFNGSSTVTYQLAKDANSVIFTVTDVMGRVISTQNAASSIGTHTINLNSYAAGVYYYSINVDGKSVTKKMIAQ